MALRPFKVGDRTFLLVEGPDVRRRDMRNRTLTVRTQPDETVYCFYQGHDIQSRIRSLPLSVRIYTTARQILEAMLRAAISDAAIAVAFEFQSGAAEPPGDAEPMRLAQLQRPPDPVTGEDAVCNYRFEGDTLIVRLLSKEFKMAEARRYAELVFDRLKPRAKRLIVDIGEVTYMNSSGISVLARSSAEFPLKIANVSEHVRNVMDVMGLLAVIEIYDSADAALAAFGAEA
jgi:anti-anti-sigma factor